jgi:hypothetical protein
MTTDALAITLHALAPTSGAGTGASVDLQADGVCLRSVLDLSLLVVALSGTMTGTVETSPDGESWYPVGTVSASVAGVARTLVPGCLRYVRATWTGSATWSLAGSAVQCLATLDELHTMGISAAALSGITDQSKIRALLAASDRVRSRALKHSGPLTTVGAGLVQATCQLAGVSLLTACVGYNPESKAHLAILEAAKAADAWLAEVAAGLADPSASDTTPDTAEGMVVLSEPLRTWGDEWSTEVE